MKKQETRYKTQIITKAQLSKFIKLGIVICLYLVSYIFLTDLTANALTAEQIIGKVDQNMLFTSARYNAKMTITIGEEKREKELVIYSEGRNKSFSEFLSPARDKGVRYLRIEDNLWMYLPSIEKIIKIAGHMLRQSMMGSDFSYEDALESSKLMEKYTATLVGSEEIDGRDCYIIDLTAKVKEVTYYRRKVWIDEQLFIALKEELYAKSGKLLKISTASKIKNFGNRNYPTYMTMQNKLRKDSLTEFVLTNIKFDIILPKGIFTQRNLKRGVL